MLVLIKILVNNGTQRNFAKVRALFTRLITLPLHGVGVGGGVPLVECIHATRIGNYNPQFIFEVKFMFPIKEQK